MGCIYSPDLLADSIVYDREARREQGGKREVVAGRAGQGNRCGEKGKAGRAGQDRCGARMESTPDSGTYSVALHSQSKVVCRSAGARARANVDIGASEVTAGQGSDGWDEGVGDQARTAEEGTGKGGKGGSEGLGKTMVGAGFGHRVCTVVRPNLHLEPDAGARAD
jgi:hypothetical protein